MNTLSLSPLRGGLAGALGLAFCAFQSLAAPDPQWLAHDRTRPQPTVIEPGTFSSQEEPGKPPSDAVVLFDGKDLSQWASMDGTPTKWLVRDGYMECAKDSGYVRTVQNFGDCQLHVEWAAPASPQGDGQGRGNSGVFLGLDRYEVQVLDSFNNKTYADGSAGSIYIQYPPLVNACREPGKWQVYDIIYTAPRFDDAGKVLSPARFTVLHNGVLIQNNVELTGPTGWLTREPYRAHPEKQPISFQDHGNPVRFRNVWVRELGKPGKKEITVADAVLQKYIGTYENGAEISRQGNNLQLNFHGVRYVLFAETPEKFFAKTTDVQCEFQFTDAEKAVIISVGEGGMKSKKK